MTNSLIFGRYYCRCYKCDDSLVGAPDGKLKQCIEHLIKLTKSDSGMILLYLFTD